MAAKSQSTLLITFMIVACMAMSVSTGLAQLAPEPQLIATSNLFTVPSQKDVFQCWSSLFNIQGCLLEIYGSLFNGQIGLINGQLGLIGPACCKAITAINGNCWPKVFPFNPFFPPLLKSYCARVGGPAPPSKGVGTSTTAKPFSRATLN